MDKAMKQTLDIIDACTGTKSTEEQLNFAADFTKPLASFANPGTGKSHSIVKGLIMAQTYHKVAGRKINAMSFTKEATGELKARYDRACKKCGVTPTVTFNTFHRICRLIMLERYPDMKIKAGFEWETDLSTLSQYMEKQGAPTDDMYYVKKVLMAIDKLNHSLIYDKENVMLSYDFRMLEMDIDVFQALRVDLFTYGLVRKCIPQGDTPLYALFVLANYPEIQAKYKAMFDIMVVDEFQDMTKLYLVILSMISSNLIVIGDMKQQIYGFNGACAEIVDEYLKIYPDARRIDLTQSFRCKDEIADYATAVYIPNDNTIRAFSGVGDGGEIIVMPTRELNIKQIVTAIREEQDKLESGLAKDYMFLFRNNFSVTPIAEELYKQGVSSRVNKFKTVMEIPIFRELCTLAFAAETPWVEEVVARALRLFPEFKNCSRSDNPLLEAMKISKKGLFDVPYEFTEQSSYDMITAMKRASVHMREGLTASQVLNDLMGVYSKYIIEEKWWKLEYEKDFYIGIVNPIIESKTFAQMVSEEYDKAKKIRECVELGVGVKCYTMHSAKGLEADYVYIIDADTDIFPSAKNMKKYIDAGCEYEAAKALREERNLLYVGITRAKQFVCITHNSEDVTPLISSPRAHSYSYLDEIYQRTRRNFDDVGAFVSLLNLGEKVNIVPKKTINDGIDDLGLLDI